MKMDEIVVEAHCIYAFMLIISIIIVGDSAIFKIQ